MSVDCGQFSGTNNCRFSNAAGSYFQLDDAYSEQQVPSAALALTSYCAKGKNPQDMNQLASFENQAFGAFNQAPQADKAHKMKRTNERYKPMDTKEVDSYLQSELEKVANKAKKENMELTQKALLDLLQPELHTEKMERQFESQEKKVSQTRRRASSISPVVSPNRSATVSPHISTTVSPIPSVCPICHTSSQYETVVTWKECQHSMISMPSLSI